MNILRIILAGLASLSINAAVAQETTAQALAVDGSCDRLLIAGEDLSAECGTALVQILEGGVVDVFVSTGGQGLFGLDEPERMVIFRGQSTEAGGAWIDHPVQFVLLGTRASDTLDTRDVSGTCSYENPADGAALIACDATDKAGEKYSLSYRTDGLPPLAF
jgi:hypothetical protein